MISQNKRYFYPDPAPPGIPSSKTSPLLATSFKRYNFLTQRRKLKIATAATAAREARNEVQRTQLRAEEEYHFHRIIGGYLGEAVV